MTGDMGPEGDKQNVPIDDGLAGQVDVEEEGDSQDDPALTSGVEDLGSKLQEIERRAAAAGLSTRRIQDPTDDHPIVELDFKGEGDDEARLDSRIRVGTLEQAEELVGLPFEDYRSIPGYAALYSPATGDIEARIRPLGFVVPGPRGLPPLDKPYELLGDPRHPGKKIELGESGALLSMLLRLPMPRPTRPMSVARFVGFSATTSAAAKRVLDEVGSALMFELDLAYGWPMQISRAQEVRRRPSAGRARSEAPPSFPLNAYDPEPIALYMYGREARGMPLLQFLAFYQAVEFYFPRYSEAELRRRLETIVKDPRFNPHRDRDIGRLLSTAVREGRQALGGERDQLKATIRACLQASDIREFVASDERRTAFFADRRSPLTDCTIALQDKNTDCRDAAAIRVYDLRCKIVHTKDGPSGDQIDLLLPNSPEARLLHEDIALLESIATRVIVASSRELVL